MIFYSVPSSSFSPPRHGLRDARPRLRGGGQSGPSGQGHGGADRRGDRKDGEAGRGRAGSAQAEEGGCINIDVVYRNNTTAVLMAFVVPDGRPKEAAG